MCYSGERLCKEWLGNGAPVRLTMAVDGEKALLVKAAWLALACLFLLNPTGATAELNFTNSLAQAALAERRGDFQAAQGIYRQEQMAEATNAAYLCILARCYCQLAYLTNNKAAQEDSVKGAVACSLQAVRVDSTNAEAHACLAVAYAKSCAFVDLKTQLAYSRVFKLEAERTIALDPRQDIAYYLLGRWNYAIANAGFLARTYVKLVYGALPEASYQAAIENFQKAMALAPDRIIHHAGLALAYEAAGEKMLALAELRRCQTLKPAGPEDEEAKREASKQLKRFGGK